MKRKNGEELVIYFYVSSKSYLLVPFVWPRHYFLRLSRALVSNCFPCMWPSLLLRFFVTEIEKVNVKNN